MTTENSVFSELKNFGAEVLLSKERLRREEQAKEKANWEEVLKDVSTQMKFAQAKGSDTFSVCVDKLTEAQRKEMAKQIMEADRRLTAVVRHHTLRDSSEADFLEVKINL